MVQNVYSWDTIHRYFPPEQIEKYRQQIINDWKSGLFKIVASAKIYKQNNIIKNKPKRLKRPEEPLQNFSMDFTQKRIKSRFGQMEALNSKMQLYEIIAGKTT